MIKADNGNWNLGKNCNFLVKSEQFGINPLDYMETQISDSKLISNWALKVEANAQGEYVAAGIGIGYQQAQSQAKPQTFIVHNGQVYILATSIKDATINHK